MPGPLASVIAPRPDRGMSHGTTRAPATVAARDQEALLSSDSGLRNTSLHRAVAMAGARTTVLVRLGGGGRMTRRNDGPAGTWARSYEECGRIHREGLARIARDLAGLAEAGAEARSMRKVALGALAEVEAISRAEAGAEAVERVAGA